MKFKKIMLVTLVLLAVLTIGAASASQDINTNETLAVEDTGEVSVDASFDDEIIGDSSENNQDSDESLKMSVDTNLQTTGSSFSDLERWIQNKSYDGYLYCDYVYDENYDSGLKDGMVAHYGDVMDGQGHIIDAKHQAAVFIFQGSVMIKNVVFKNIKMDAIRQRSIYNEVNIANCTFINCCGTVIDTQAKSTHIRGCRFENCDVSLGYLSRYSLVILDDLGDEFSELDSCTFVNCTTQNGYGVTCSMTWGNISNCVFIDCLTPIWSMNAVNVINSSFINCEGEIIADSVRSCNITNCSSGSGGPVNCNNVYDSNFINCFAHGDGYIMLSHGGGVSSAKNVVNCYFMNCSAYYGGAVYDVENITGSTFINCIAVYGGAVYGGTKRIENSAFIDNFANEGDNWYGSDPVLIDVYCKNSTVPLNEINTTEIIDPNFDAKVDSIDGKYLVSINITADERFSEEVSVVIDGGRISENYDGAEIITSYSGNLRLTNGYLKIYDYLCPGYYYVTVTFNGNEFFAKSTASYRFYVYRLNKPIPTTISYGEMFSDGNITIWVNDLYQVTVPNATISYTINNVTRTASLSDGALKLDLSDLMEPCDIFVEYEGNEKYAPCNTTIHHKLKPTLNIEVDDDLMENTPFLIKVTANDDINGSVYVWLEDSYSINLTDGYGELGISGLNAGEYWCYVEYYGNERYSSAGISTKINVAGESQEGDSIILSVDTQNEYSTYPEDLPAIFACVTVPEGTQGNVTFTCNDRILYNLALSDFMVGRIDRENNRYNIALEVDGEFIFEGCDDGDCIRFAFLDENGDEIACNEYLIFFGDNTVRFELNAHNPGDHVSIDVGGEVNINDGDDFVFINLPSGVTEGSVVVVSGNFTLFEESVNFNEGTHWWKEIDNHYVCSFSPNSLTNWDKLSTGDTVTFAFLDGDGQVVESRDYAVTVEDDNVRFDESQQIEVNIWNSDENGILYTDLDYSDIVSVNVPPNCYGTIFVIVDGEERDSWGIEHEDDDWAHHEWGLFDLGIFGEGNYNVTVKHDDEILTESMLQVVKDTKDKFRPVFILDMIRLYCPANVTGNVIISFEGQDDMGNTYPACSDFTYEIAPEESGTWIEWTTEDLGIDLDTYYRVTVNVEDDAGETLYNLTRWHEFVLYPEYESRIWYRTSTEIIDHDYFSWELYNRIGYYHKWGKRSVVSIYINDDDWNALPDYVFDYTDYPTGCYHISLDDIGINSVGEYYIRADYQWGDEEDGCDAYITVYEPQEASGIVDHDIAGDHYLTIEILPVRKIISGNTWDDYVIEFKGEFENYMGLGSTIEIAFENGTRVVLDLEDVFRHNGKLGSEELKINKEGEYYITVTVTGNVNQRIVKCSGIIRYLSPVQVELDMANLRTDKLYIGYGLDDNTYIALWPRDNFCELNDIEGNVSVYINGKLDKTFNIKQLPIVGDQPDNMNYFIPLSLLSDIPVGNNTITVIYEGNEPSVEKTQNFTAVMLTADKFFEYATINIDEDVYSDQVTPVKIYFSGNPMSADPLIWGKLVLYVNGERINRTVVVIYEDDEIQGIYDETDPEAIELINRIHTSNPEGLYYDRFDWLNLAFLHWYCDDGLKYLSLDDLNITSEGVYNITLNYFGYDDVWDANSGYVGRGSELRLISQNMNYTTDNTHMKVVITPENKYTVNTPSLINFELGEDYWNPSTERTYNNVVVYINNTLAFNDTLVRYTYGDWDAQIKIFGGASSNCISRDLLNEFDCLDEGNYHADVYMENDGKLTGIASGDFSVIKQRGDMSFSIDSSVDLGEHAFLYADIPQSLVEDYELVLRIRVDDEDIDVDVGKITGQGEVPVDLGVLRKGAHVVYVELAPDTNNWDDFYNVSKNFYNNYFKVNVIGNNATVTPETFGDFFDENGVLTSDADDLIFEGVFNNVTMTINHPVSLIGNGATFNDVSIIVESDDVSIENLEFIFTASEDADSYAVLVSGVSNFGMVNNTVVYVGKTKGEGINNAVRITDSSSVVLRNNNFMISLVSAAGSWAEDPVGSGNWVTHTVSEGIVVSDSRDIDFEDNVVIISYNNVSGSFDEIYGVSFRNSDNARVTGNVISARGHTYVYAVYVSGNEFGIYDNEIDAESDVNYACAINVEGPASGIIENNNVHAKAPTSVYAILSSMGDVGVSYTSNEITAEGYFIFGIYDDSEEIIGNTITLTGNYTVGIVVLSDATVENNKITLIASNVGSESVWETVPMETSGIVVRADAAILNNEISSNHKSISILGGSSTITDNTLIGYVHVASNDNTFTGNMINTTGEYAVDLGSSTGNVITENELYANELEGDSAVNGDKLANEIYGNYPSNLTDAVLVVEAYDITEGENVTIEVTLPSDAEGMVTLTVDGMNFNSNVIDGKAVFNFADLSVGSYEVLASYSGDAKYRATQNTTEFTVNPSSASESRLVIAVDDITYGENLTITVSTVDGVDCNVSLFFDGAVTNIQLVGGTGSATFSNVNAGRYVVKADIKSGESIVDSVNTTVKVNRADSVLNVSDVEFEWNANGTAVVSYTGATGVKANVVNQTAVIDVVNGTITISGLNPGEYTLNVTTIVDDNHNPVTETSSIKVSKAASSVAVDVESQFNVGDEITITVTNSTACVVTVNSIVCDVEDGKVIIDSAELGEGTYEVIATIAEDDFFKGSSANATFKVSLIDTSISVENATLQLLVGENRTIGVVVAPEGLKVDFTTGNSSVVSVDENGNVVAVGAGSAIIYLSVGDNVAYKYSQATVNVTVRKIPTQIILERDSFDLYAKNYIEDFASLNPADAGNLTFVSSDNSVVSIVYDAIFANGTGTATVTVSFAGNDKYAAAESKTITVTVSLKDSSVSVENDTLDLNVDDRYDLNATTVPGFLPVEYVSSNVSVATVTDYGIVTAVGEGTAIITLTVGNGETYAVNSTSVTVKVSKLPSEIITVSDALDLVAGDEVSSPASLSPSAAGDLAYVISNEDVVKIVNGNIVAVGSGNATVTYSFAGNDKYAAAESKTITVTVSKAKVPIDNDSFNFDENKTVESKTPSYSINLPSDATGNLTVIIGDKTYTAEVVNGTATIVVNDLPAGDYNVTVAYSGDGKYSAIVKTSKAKVKVDPRIVASDLTVQHTAGKYYSVTVYGDNGKVASGVLVTFYLKGKKVTTTRTDAKGIAKFLVTQTPMSKAQVKAVALGKTVTKKLTIKRVVSIKSISVKRTSKKIVLKATLAKVNGKYLVGKKITFKFNGKTFKAVKTKSRGVATLTLTPKKYNAVFKKLSKTKKGKKITYSATYSGDTVKKTVKIK